MAAPALLSRPPWVRVRVRVGVSVRVRVRDRVRARVRLRVRVRILPAACSDMSWCCASSREARSLRAW